MNAAELKETLMELAACAAAWQPQARLLGNVTAGDMFEAMHRAVEAVDFVEERGHYYAARVEIAGYNDTATRIRDAASDVLDDGVWARRVGYVNATKKGD